MQGTIRCGRCGRTRTGYKCEHCGSYKCYVKLYWKGRDYQYRRDQHGTPMGYYEAERLLTVLRSKIDAHNKGRDAFNPLDFLQSRIKELRFGSLIDKWLAEKRREVERSELSQGTLETYESYRRTWWKALDHKDVRDIGAQELKAFNLSLPHTLKIKTRRNILNALHAFMKWLWREEIIKTIPPFPEIKGNDSSPRKAITIEAQAEALARIPAGHRDIFAFGFETGLREGELAALKVKDLDLPAGELTVQRTYTSGNVLHERDKGKKKATVPLSTAAIEIARKNAADKLPEAFLFINSATGSGYLPQYIYKLWQSTGVPVTFHEATRHSFCTQIARTGAHPEKQRLLMRHSDIRTTMRYTHMDVTDLRDIVNQRGKVIQLSQKKKRIE